MAGPAARPPSSSSAERGELAYVVPPLPEHLVGGGREGGRGGREGVREGGREGGQMEVGGREGEREN